MRVNIYAEELSERVELVHKEVEGQQFTALRFYLELPVTVDHKIVGSWYQGTSPGDAVQLKGPFMHRPGDDDSSAVTFWGKREMIPLLERALKLLYDHYQIDYLPKWTI